ncbi:MAG: HPr family phosphocarrier protein [Acidobacteriota bacterium]|nr:MAG: HPr family phosphocarrier protein [Acidobacteriota bacterium]
MVEGRVEIINVLGLHARAAARFVRTATKYRASVTVSKDGTTTDGKSILGILFLAASVGSEITIAVNGEDEDEALKALVELVADGLGEKSRH